MQAAFGVLGDPVAGLVALVAAGACWGCVPGLATVPAGSRGFGRLSLLHMSNLWLQIKELDTWCRISSAGFSPLSEAVV